MMQRNVDRKIANNVSVRPNEWGALDGRSLARFLEASHLSFSATKEDRQGAVNSFQLIAMASSGRLPWWVLGLRLSEPGGTGQEHLKPI